MKTLFKAVAFALAAAAATAGGAVAADWTPPGPIKLMIGFRAGGGADTQARLIAEELEARHGWKLIPEQVTGKGGATLAAALKDEPNDGTAIGMLVTESLGYNMVSARNPGYTEKDFTPITTTAGFQMGVVALTSKGWKTMADVFEAAKGGQAIRFGVMSPKLADLAYLMGKANGVEFNIVMVRGGKAVMDGLNGGDLDVGWGAGIQTKAVQAGDMVNLASGLSVRLDATPDAPLMSDLGVEFTADGYFLFVAPAGLSAEARAAMASAIGEIITDKNSKAASFIDKGFGGAKVIQGAELDALMAAEVSGAKGLLAAASE